VKLILKKKFIYLEPKLIFRYNDETDK